VGLAFFAYRRKRLDEVLPWDRIDCGVTKAYLQKQLAAARNLAEVVDCVLAPCTVCGACDYDVVKNRTYSAEDYQRSREVGRAQGPEAPEARAAAPSSELTRTHIRVKFAKAGRLVALSHLEMMHSLLRAIRRARLPMAYSQGYHPKPRVSFGPALPVGVESFCEYMDLELVGIHQPEPIAGQLAAALPPGLDIQEAVPIDPRTPSISASMRAVHYVAEFPREWTAERLSERVSAYEALSVALVVRAAPKGNPRNGGEKIAQGKAREIDLKDIVTHVAVEGAGRVAFSLRADPSGSAKPAEVLGAIFGEGSPPKGVKVLKEGVSFARTGSGRSGQPRAPRYLDA
jgi:radical SAM-linked protein